MDVHIPLDVAPADVVLLFARATLVGPFTTHWHTVYLLLTYQKAHLLVAPLYTFSTKQESKY